MKSKLCLTREDCQKMAAGCATALRGAMMEGGVPVMVDGQCVGAIGVSGVKSPEDAQIARAGIKTLLG